MSPRYRHEGPKDRPASFYYISSSAWCVSEPRNGLAERDGRTPKVSVEEAFNRTLMEPMLPETGGERVMWKKGGDTGDWMTNCIMKLQETIIHNPLCLMWMCVIIYNHLHNFKPTILDIGVFSIPILGWWWWWWRWWLCFFVCLCFCVARIVITAMFCWTQMARFKALPSLPRPHATGLSAFAALGQELFPPLFCFPPW